jgi:hypothetical protein
VSLLDLQRRARDRIIADRAAPLAGAAATAGPGLAVYRNAYRAQLAACLRDTYEKTWAWLGDEAFEMAAQVHISLHPPASWTLGDYGGDLPEILRALYPDDTEVSELAWLDWTLRRAFDGPDAEPIQAEALAQVDWDSAVLAFVPTLVLGSVATNCAAIWTAIAEGESPPSAAPLAEPAAIRVWRAGLSPQYCSIDGFEFRALSLALSGLAFGELCQRLAEGEDAEAAIPRLGQLLGCWLQDGLIRFAT